MKLLIHLTSVPIFLSVLPGLASSPKAEVGFEFEGFQTLNSATIVSTEYTGECPGSKGGTIKARFLSSSTSPAPGLRVVITNISRGFGGDSAPFSDREYDKGQYSERINVAPATRHNLRYLSVLTRENKFEYEIKRGEKIIEKGNFTVVIDTETKTRDRFANRSFERYCLSGRSLEDCKERDIALREVKNCPLY